MDTVIAVEVYSSGTTRIPDPAQELVRAESLTYETQYPGGLYGSASFLVKRDIVQWWAVKGAKRLIVRAGQQIAYEGVIDDLESVLTVDSEYIRVNVTGYWGTLMSRRRWRKIWADQRVTESVWIYQTDTSIYTGADKTTLERENRLRFVSKAEAWNNGEFAAVRYTMPIGETIKRLIYDYELAEGVQQWEISAWRSTDASSWTQMTAGSGETYNVGTTTAIVTTGTGSIDVELGTASRYLELRFYARAGQTGKADGSYFGEFTGMTVYSETSAIDLQQIAADVVGEMSAELNADTIQISTCTMSLVPFIADNFETMADILYRAAARGDASFNTWHVGLLHSETATTPDGKPVLYAEQRPALSSYDYCIRLDESNLVAPLSIVKDYSQIANWIIVEYTDANGWTQYRTPDDNAALTDSTSVSDYGQRDYLVYIGDADTTLVDSVGQRYLARYKDPQYSVTAPIQVVGYIRKTAGDLLPASLIRAGKRVTLQNYPDVVTFLISGTLYDAESQICRLAVGALPPLILPAFAHPVVTEAVAEERERTSWKQRLEMTTAEREQWKMMTWAEKLAWISAKRAYGGRWRQYVK